MPRYSGPTPRWPNQPTPFGLTIPVPLDIGAPLALPVVLPAMLPPPALATLVRSLLPVCTCTAGAAPAAQPPHMGGAAESEVLPPPPATANVTLANCGVGTMPPPRGGDKACVTEAPAWEEKRKGLRLG